jgi:hypothetical protein
MWHNNMKKQRKGTTPKNNTKNNKKATQVVNMKKNKIKIMISNS